MAEEYEQDIPAASEQRENIKKKARSKRKEKTEVEGETQIDIQKVDDLGRVLREKREEAIQGRTNSGIEEIWLQDEEYFEGIDDANRMSLSSWQGKPLGQAGIQDNTTGSTVFIPITKRYCEAASARLGDVLLPSNDRAWELEPTPVADLIPMSEGKIDPSNRQAVRKSMEQEADAEIVMGGAPVAKDAREKLIQGKVEKTEGKIVAWAQTEVAKSQKKIDKATKRIEDWMVECNYHAEVRQVLDDITRIGSGVLKGPVPVFAQRVAYVEGKMIIEEKVQPGSHSVSPWNIYPDPGCGQNVHDGSYIWERDDINIREVDNLRYEPGYIEEQIDKVLDQGPFTAIRSSEAEKKNSDVTGLQPRDTKNMYEIWYYHGLVTKDELEAAGCKCPKDAGRWVDAQVTMINNIVIRATINPLKTGEFPYDIMVWQKRYGMCWGIGVASQVRTPQDIINGAARHMMDNAGRASGPQVVMHPGIIEPEDGIHEIVPWKIWWAADEADLQGLDNAFRFVKIDMHQAELQSIMMLGMQLAEEATGMPSIMQGQTNSATPDTFSGMQLQNENASTVLRRVARLFDDLLTEPHLRRYYQYLLQHGPEDDEKGEFIVKAVGSSALIERDNNSQELMQIAELVMNPAFKKDPKKWLDKYMKSRRMEPAELEYDDQDWQQLVQQIMQPQEAPDPALEIAHLRAEVERYKTDANLQSKDRDRQSREDIAAYQMAHEKELETMRAEVKLLSDSIMTDMESLRLRGRKEETLEKIKADLGKMVLTIDAQERMSKMQGGQVATPVVEPPGRAAPGRGFEQ